MFGVLPSDSVLNIDLCKTNPTNKVLIPTICFGFNCILGPLHPLLLPFGYLLAWEIFSFSNVRTLKKLTTRPKSYKTNQLLSPVCQSMDLPCINLCILVEHKSGGGWQKRAIKIKSWNTRRRTTKNSTSNANRLHKRSMPQTCRTLLTSHRPIWR